MWQVGKEDIFMNLDFRIMFRNSFGLLFVMMGFMISACSTPPETKVDVADTTPGMAVIESVRTDVTSDRAIITFVCSKRTTHGDPFALANPARISFDIMGKPAKDIPGQVKFKIGPVKEILIKDKKDGIAGVVVYVRHERNDSRFIKRGKDIVFEVTPVKEEKRVGKELSSHGSPDPSQPQILDVNITQRKGNRTRLSIKTDKKVEYDVKLHRTVLIIKLKEGAISPELMKKLDTEHSEGAIKNIKAFHSALDKQSLLRVKLDQLTPYHITQDGAILNIDFDPVPESAPPAVKRPAAAAPLKKAEPAAVKKAFGKDKGSESVEPVSRAGGVEVTSKPYAGEHMSFDFVDTDIRNILQLISEVAGINIVWGSDVEGKISLKLNNVPWDQAMEMILKPNGLTYQIEDDVLWVVPEGKLRDIELKADKRKGALMAAKRLQGIFETKIIEFIKLKHRSAHNIYTLLVGGEVDTKEVVNGKLVIKTRKIPPLLDIEAAKSTEENEGEEESGKKTEISTMDLYITYDSGANVIAVNGVRAKVEKVKELIKILDAPVKQVMVEARIVEATTGFARDLGIQWRSLDGKNPGVKGAWYNSSGSMGSGQFSTNAPSDTWAPNIGMAVGILTGGGLGSIALDASLALAEYNREVKIISAPKVMTINGELAQIMRGETAFIRIATQLVTSVEEVPALLSLNVIPTVSGDNTHIRMLVLVTDQVMAQDLNSRTEKNVSANMTVPNGDTIVIGGIYREDNTRSDSGVPWLKDIPVLGWLFKAQEDIKLKNELLIFITPTVIISESSDEG